MRICVIGGGLCGLVAAERLTARFDIEILERNPVLGGCLGSFRKQEYMLENFYHHCFPNDTAFFSLLDMLGVCRPPLVPRIHRVFRKREGISADDRT